MVRFVRLFVLLCLISAACAGCVNLDVDSLLYQCSNASPNACGDGYFCARDGVCRPVGFDDSDLTLPPSDTNDTQEDGVSGCGCAAGQVCLDNKCAAVVELALGGRHSCARLDDKRLACWGDNTNKQSDPKGGADPITKPRVIPYLDGGSAVSICAGESHSCLLVDVNPTTKEVHCWGDIAQLGTNGPDVNTGMTKIELTTRVSHITCGANHTCAQVGDTEVYCWGTNDQDQLANPGFNEKTPIIPGGLSELVSNAEVPQINQVAAGNDHTCVLYNNSNSMACWGGLDDVAKLGRGTTADASVTADVILGGTFELPLKKITGGVFHTCTFDNAGIAFCWGVNTQGQLGTGLSASESSVYYEPNAFVSTTAPAPSVLQTIIEIDAGDEFTCALIQNTASQRKVFCWGLNRNQQIGETTATDYSNIAKEIKDIPNMSRIFAGSTHACTIQLDTSDVFCWGGNGSGQLGDGTTTDSKDPKKIFD